MLKVLVVEDEYFVRKGIVKGTDWKSLGEVILYEADNGETGLEIVEEKKPDVIVTDIRMPGKSGIEMIRALREKNNDTAVIFLSAYDEFEFAREALRLGACDYILKPFGDGELEEVIRRIVRENMERCGGNSEKEKVFLPELGGNRHILSCATFIEENFGNPELSVASIAEHLAVSESHMAHLFKKETDMSLGSYIARYRIRMAMGYLKDCRMRVGEVAFLVGYRDVGAFTNAFKKYVSETPTAYQKTLD